MKGYQFGPASGETQGEYLERVQQPDIVDRMLAGRIRHRESTEADTELLRHRSEWLWFQRRHWNRTDLRPALRQDTDNILRRCKAQQLTASDADDLIEDAIRLDRVTADYQFTETELAEIIEYMKVTQ